VCQFSGFLPEVSTFTADVRRTEECTKQNCAADVTRWPPDLRTVRQATCQLHNDTQTQRERVVPGQGMQFSLQC